MPQKCCGTRDRNADRRRLPAFVEHLSSRKRCISIAYHPMMMAGVIDAVMVKVTFKIAGHSIREFEGLMYYTAIPFALAAIKEPQLPIRVPSAVPDRFAHIKRKPRYGVTGTFAARGV